MMDLSTPAHIARMERLRDHHAAKAETEWPTADFHASEAVYLDTYIAAARKDFARAGRPFDAIQALENT